MKPVYKRIIIKASGQSLGKGERGDGIDQTKIEAFCKRVIDIKNAFGTQIGLVVGAGNLFRGRDSEDAGFKIHKADADAIGMVATVMNSLLIKYTLNAMGTGACIFSAIPMPPVVDGFNRHKALKHLEEGEVTVFAAGTGNPYFSTDSAAALRAAELDAEIIVKATRVDGVYTADPEKDPSAKKYDKLSYDEVIMKNLKVMDAEAFAICRNQRIPIAVLNINASDSIERLLKGEAIGTFIGG